MEPIKKVPFTKEMKKTHTILIPTMLPIHFRILGNVLENYGYKVKVLDNCGPGVIEQGLKNVHNDTCYPAQLVIGQMIDALEHSDLPLDKVALLITQTGGGCRASNYIYLLRKALNKCGYGDIPVISASFMKSEQSGGFSLPVAMLLQALYGVGKPVAAVLRRVNKFLRGRKSDMIRLIEQYSDFQPPCHFESTIESAKGYIGQGVKMGEGWLLTAEMVELIQHYKVNNIVCTQPFGCLPNHICGKGVMRVIKEKNPQANIVAVDYDSSASKVNQQNRIKLMLANARLIEQNSQQPKQDNTPAAPQQETVAAAPQRREQVAQN